MPNPPPFLQTSNVLDSILNRAAIVGTKEIKKETETQSPITTTVAPLLQIDSQKGRRREISPAHPKIDEEELKFLIELMDLEVQTFGRGPREVGGAADLINQYKLWPHHEFFCQRSLPLSISETRYLHNVLGDTEIRKGEGMQLEQLFQNTNYMRERDARIHAFDLDILREAFQLRETNPIDQPSAEKGILTAVVKSKIKSIKEERKHKKLKNKVKDHKKQKHRHKDRNNDNRKSRSGHPDSGPEYLKKQQDKVMGLQDNITLGLDRLAFNLQVSVHIQFGYMWTTKMAF